MCFVLCSLGGRIFDLATYYSTSYRFIRIIYNNGWKTHPFSTDNNWKTHLFYPTYSNTETNTDMDRQVLLCLWEITLCLSWLYIHFFRKYSFNILRYHSKFVYNAHFRLLSALLHLLRWIDNKPPYHLFMTMQLMHYNTILLLYFM